MPSDHSHGGANTARCYRHPDRETEVSCGRCERPLCPDCVQFGPTGVRCAECLRLPRTARGLATGSQVARGAGFALLVAAPGGLLLGWIHWLSLTAAVLLGLAIGSAALVGSGQHRDWPIQAIAALLAALAIVIAGMVMWVPGLRVLGLEALAVMLSRAGFVVPLAVAVIAAVVRFRF